MAWPLTLTLTLTLTLSLSPTLTPTLTLPLTFQQGRKTPHYLRKLRSASGSTDNHATSGLKFQILHELLSVSRQ